MKLTVEEVVNKAIEFVKNSGYTFAKLVKVEFKNKSKWEISIDVGVLTTVIIKKITIDDNTGKIIGYE